MAQIIFTRTFEADVTLGGLGVSSSEVFADADDLWLGLGTNASEINNLAAGTRIELVQGSVSVVYSIVSRSAVTGSVVYYTASKTSGTVNFTDGEEVTVKVGDPPEPITFTESIEDQVWETGTEVDLTLPAASEGTGDKNYTLTPDLPDGVSRSDFSVTGTPTTKFDTADFTWKVTDDEGTASLSFSILVELKPHPVTVLPLPSTLLEKALVDFYGYRQTEVLEHEDEIPIRHLWNPDTCPEDLLVYLACAMSIDAVSVQFSETQLRQLIRDAHELHTRKGTVQALKDVIAALGYSLTQIDEGVVSSPAVPATDWARYRLVMSTALSVANAENLKILIEDAAPVSRELVEITYDEANPYDGSIRYDGTFNYGRINP